MSSIALHIMNSQFRPINFIHIVHPVDCINIISFYIGGQNACFLKGLQVQFKTGTFQKIHLLTLYLDHQIIALKQGLSKSLQRSSTVSSKWNIDNFFAFIIFLNISNQIGGFIPIPVLASSGQRHEGQNARHIFGYAGGHFIACADHVALLYQCS
jgi:hypothetical protein